MASSGRILGGASPLPSVRSAPYPPALSTPHAQCFAHRDRRSTGAPSPLRGSYRGEDAPRGRGGQWYWICFFVRVAVSI